jgi:hypothetical protein
MHPFRRNILKNALQKVRHLKKQGKFREAIIKREKLRSEDQATFKPQLEGNKYK